MKSTVLENAAGDAGCAPLPDYLIDLFGHADVLLLNFEYKLIIVSSPIKKPTRVMLCVRAPMTMGTYERQQTIQEQLRTLQEKGHVGELSIRVWRKQVPTSGGNLTDSGTQTCIHLYEKFQSWADQAGCSLEPGFSKHTIDSLVTDNQQEVIRFPIICLAAYDDDELINLAPRSTASGVYTVADFIAALETNERKPVETVSGDPVESN